MRKSLFKNICLTLACLLGIGGLAGAALTSPKEATQVSAASTYYTEKKTVLFMFDPETNKGATTLSETNNTGTWKVSRAADSADYYAFWRGIPSSETVTFTRNQSLKHIYQVVVYIQQFYSQTDSTYYPVKGTVSIGNTVVGTATSDGSSSSSSIFVNTVAYKGDEKDGVVKVSLNAVNSSTYSFYFNHIEIYYREYSAIPVTLNDNGGSGGSGTINCTYDETMPTSVKVPTRPGYRFDGYYIGTKQYYKGDGTRAVTKFDINAESATLTAKWTLMEFDITLDDNEGTGGQGSVKAIYGNSMPNLTTLPTRTGYTFQGYYSAKSGGTQYFDADGKGIGTYNLTKATTVYARWEANKYNVSFAPTQGSGGITALEATYDVPLRDLTSEEIPTREPSHGHSYSFGGYYTEAPTEDENGYQTPHGKCYINDLGKGVLWKEASNTTLYAYWTVDMTVTSSGYEGTWDNQYHGITVNVIDPEDAIVWYGTTEGQCSSTNANNFLRKDAGTYTIYYEVRKDSYSTYRHSETIVIGKDVSKIDPRPTAIEELEFTNEEQELVNAGTVDYGNMLYALSTEKVTDASSLLALSFSENIPTAKLVGTYYVYYTSSGDNNHYEYGVSEDNYVEVSISEVNKTALKAKIDEAQAYLETIKDEYTSIGDTLNTSILATITNFLEEANVTAEQITQAILDLQASLSEAKVAVVEDKINNIGTVSYPDSKDVIYDAYNYYNDILKEDEQSAVDTTLLDTLNKDYADYVAADIVATLIKDIPEASASENYYVAVEDAKAAYDNLLAENIDAKALLDSSTEIDFEKVLQDNVSASEVIHIIQNIGELTYNGGDGDSLAKIEAAEQAYADLKANNPDAAAIVDVTNHTDLVDARESYEEVEDVINKINNIGVITHDKEGINDSKEDLDIARTAYDALSEEEKALVTGYNNSTKTLEDGEAVYEAMVKIDDIGEVSYDTRSDDTINEAREVYDSLTSYQQAQLGDKYLNTLTTAETKYSELKKTADILVIILLIVASLVFIGGIWFLIVLFKKKKDKDDDQNSNGGSMKKGQVKVASFTGFLPFMVLTSNYLSGPWLALYVITGAAVLLWISILVIAIMKKKQVGPFKKKEASITQNEDEEVETISDEKGNIFQIRYVKSFTAKLIQASEETKKYYEELKNEVLSYKGTNSRVSWHYDAVNSGRNYVLKFAIRGKTLGVYLPLDPDSLDEKYKVERSESKRYEDVPCLYRIKNDRRLGYAKELIAVVAANLGLTKGEEQHEVYSNLPYEPNKPLIERGLIKELKVQVNKPAVVNEDEEESVTITDEKGNIFNIRYVKSFTAKLIQSSDETKKYYEELKNEILSYKSTHSRISWHYDSVNAGRNQVLKFVVRGKTLCVYLPLSADDYADSKYKVEKSESKKYEEVPCLYRIKNDRRLGYAKELIAVVAVNLGLEKGEEQHEVYSNLPYEPNKPLIERGLIKELKVQVNKPVETVIETKEDEEGNEVVVSEDNLGNKYETRFIKSFTAKLSQASDEVKDYYNELKNHALSYKGTLSRVSWNYDTINVNNKGILKFVIKRKNLYLYYALDTSKIGQKYKVEHVEYKRYEDVPTMLMVNSGKRKELSKELIDRLMRKNKCELGKNLNDGYRIPFESKEVLIRKGLIKEVKVKI